MNKRKVKQVQVTWENGETDTFDVDATFSESINARKKAGFSNLEEWVEYHITWITMIRDLPPVGPTQEELEKKWDAELAEKRKNPKYAGTSDGKDFFYPDTAKVSTLVDFGLDDVFGSSNGQL